MGEQINRQLGSARRVVNELGLGPALKAVRRNVLPTARRNAVDDRNLALLLAFVLDAEANCIDVGAHRGDVLRVMVHNAPRGQHMAFEPIPDFYEDLRAAYPSVVVRRAALSDQVGTSSFAYVRSRPAYSGLRERLPEGTEEVEHIQVDVETLDDTVPADYSLTLLKIDVEGGEYGVLKGGLKLLTRSRPHVVFEFGSAAREYGTTPDQMYDLLDGDVGLRIYDMTGAGPYTRSQFRQIFESGRRFNFVAHA
ncbi:MULTISPECIES: FkbM family methyltransferase [Pseudofrankia]|uniref:FkbM family methyltransferase n=1 Tax=Pseudofrankia TaxID=2994363 RepID=UPI000234B9A2|nr:MULTISPECIES: FkbM family methyltransferase [Pseudofrankia]OHV37815.1 methyltransferase FkbM [Pseudofrankia sp. EUN1h]